MKRDRMNFLFVLAGARAEVLKLCPTERIRFQSLGTAILITSGIAAVSMWFALNSALGVNAFLALPAAIVWGLVIMGIDRWLVTSMPTSGRRRWTIALPRLLLALLLGSLISTPIVLRIFQSEINAEIVIIKAQRASAFLAQQQNSKVGQQVAYWSKDVSNLQKVIDSGGSAPLNRATDPVLAGLTKQLAAEVKLQHMYYNQWQCQLYGGHGCTKKGNGPLAQASHRSYQQATAQVNKINGEIQARDRQLTSSDAASKRVRLQQAESALPAAKRQLTTATARENVLQQKYDAENLKTNGLLIRLQALNQLSGQNFTINAARLLLFLLFLVIECLPVTVKLMQQPGIYEKILENAAEQELREARKTLRGGPRTRGASEPAGNTPAATAAELREIWRRPVHEPPPTPTRSMTPLEPSRETPTQTVDHTRPDDEALRGMANVQDETVTADADWRKGGTELHYGTHEL